MKADFILVPYQQCEEGVGNGAGPLRLAAALRERGPGGDRPFMRVQSPVASDDETEMMTRLNTALAREVRAAVQRKAVPFVLSGHCYTCLGVLGGLQKETGLVWIDAHGDFNTPATTPSGYLDGMGLAIATGRCHADIRRAVGMTSPQADPNVLHIAARDLDPPEQANFRQSEILFADAARLERVPEKLETLASRVRQVYLHVDLDVLDPAAAPGVIFKAPGGIPRIQLDKLVRSVTGHFPIAAVNITGFNPDLDQGNRTLEAGLELIKTILDTANGASWNSR